MVRAAVTKEESSKEVKVLRQRVGELEAREAEYKKIEKALRESEERLRTMMEASSEGFALHDGNKVFDVNENGARMFGCTSSKMVGKNARDFVAPESLDLVLRNIATNYTQPYQAVFKRINGSTFPVEIKAKKIIYKGRDVRLVSFRDLTVQKQFNNMLETIVVNAPVSMSVEQNRRFKFVNRQFCLDLGYTEEEIMLMDVMQGVHPEDRALVRNNTIQMLKGERTEPFEFRAINKGGDTRWVLQSVSSIIYDGQRASLSTHLDFTEQRKAELALRESEQNLREAQSLGRIGSWELDFATQQIRWSDEVYDLYERDKALGPPSLEEEAKYYAPEQTRKLREYALLSIETGKEYNYDLTANLPSGKTLVLNASVRPIKDEQGLVVSLFGTVQDITERKQAEQLLVKSEQKYRLLSENVTDIVWTMDIKTQKFDYISPSVERIRGYTPAEAMKIPLDKSLTPASYEYGTNVLMEELVRDNLPGIDPDRIRTVQFEETCKGGLTIPTEVRLKFLHDANGLPTHVIGITRDISERTRAEKALKVSEENYRNSIDTSPMGVEVFTNDEKILYANKAILDIYGFKDIEELRNTPIKERFTPESYTEYLIRSAKFKSGETTSLGYELSIRRKDGTIRHLQAFRKEIIWDAEKQFQLLYNDITERKKAEDAMRESRARFRELARLLPLSIWETNENGIITYTNEKAMKLYGYSRLDTVPGSYLQNVIPEDRDRAERNTQRILQGETLTGIEYTALKKDGSTFPVRIYASAIVRNGKSVGLRGITIDVTEQKMAEKRLEQAAHEWRTTFDSITDKVCLLDNNFRIVRINRAYAKMFNKEPQELLGKTCYELIHKTDRPRRDCPHQETLQTGKPARVEYFESTLGIYIEAGTSPVFSENGDVKGSVCVIRDISERKQMEQQLMLTDRLASVGELASGVAHELNNPLTSVIGFSQLLMEGKIPENIKEDLGLINSEAQRAANIIKNLLTFARKHAAVKQPTRLNNIIDDVLKLRSYEQKVNNIEVKKDLTPDLPEIMVDYFQIQQVFLNIIINAEFFMTDSHHGGVLTIKTLKIGQLVRVLFSDDGPGIPRENLNRIFDPFFTTKDVGKGTGLGLSICHGIIAEHGGKIYAESEVGKGATFIIELPVSDK